MKFESRINDPKTRFPIKNLKRSQDGGSSGSSFDNNDTPSKLDEKWTLKLS